jgi:hypothetical protein
MDGELDQGLGELERVLARTVWPDGVDRPEVDDQVVRQAANDNSALSRLI